MGKSLGNFVTIKDALRMYRPEVIRTFMQSVHYSSPVDYTEEAIQGAGRGWERLMNAVRLTRRALPSASDTDAGDALIDVAKQARADFIAAMDDDFNTPGAIAALQELTRHVNGWLNSATPVGLAALNAVNDVYTQLGGTVLGIVPLDESSLNSNAGRETALIDLIIELRQQARKNKNWAESDRLRDELAKLGVILEDRADGTIWKVT
jgi:cysteinyl-tRNA synthetase